MTHDIAGRPAYGIPSINVQGDDRDVRIAALEARVREVESQLPESMRNCTIVFRECEKGHGWLTATNWIQHECPTCDLAAARVAKDVYEGLIDEAKDLLIPFAVIGGNQDQQNAYNFLLEQSVARHQAQQ